MSDVEIIQSEEGGWYKLKDCPFNFKFPMACQVKGCPYWKGYMFKNAMYKGFKNYISSLWRRNINGNNIIADYVVCGFFTANKETNNEA